MTIFRRGRFLYWLGRELVEKYSKAIIVGIVLGISVMAVVWKLYPYMQSAWFAPVERIGVVGEFTPSTLPQFIQQHLSFGLTTLSDDGKPLPGLATSWESTDSGKSYIFHIRDDLLWPDGESVTSKDINYNIRDVVFTPLDIHTLKATLNDPYSPFPTLVAKPILKRGLLGFGTYKVAAITLKGDFIQLLRLGVSGDPSKSLLEYRFYRNEQQAITAYKLGDIDTVIDITSGGDLSDWKGTKVESRTSYNQIVALFFNQKDNLLAERAVRQALGYALPETPNERAFSPISKVSWVYTDKIRRFTPNINQAKKQLSGADIDLTGKEITITTFPQYHQTAQAIAASWSELGITAKVKIENALPPNFQVLLSLQTVPPDPDQYHFWHSTQTGTNITGYTNVKIDKILEDARKEQDEEERKKMYSDFQRFLVEDAPAIFYYYPVRYTIKRI